MSDGGDVDMKNRINTEFAVGSAGRHRAARVRDVLRRKPAALILGGFLSVLILAAGQRASAAEPNLNANITARGLAGVAQPAWPAGRPSRDDAVVKLADYAEALEPRSSGRPEVRAGADHAGVHGDRVYSELLGFVQQIDAERPKLARSDESRFRDAGDRDAAFSALLDYAQQVGAGRPDLILAAGEKTGAKAKGPVKAESDEAVTVGSQVCLGCHAVQTAAFNQTLMGRIFRNPRNAQERGGCETCHGAGSLHVKAGGGRGVGGIISFRNDDKSRSVADNNAICLSCHERGHQTYWKGSTHETRNVACTNCHQVMQKVSPRFQLAKGTELETCFQCHQEKRAKIMRSAHMPLGERKMTCSDCHQPHGGATEALLKGTSINDTCFRCHADKRGPFLWEHPPVRENCMNCHDPHGTNNEYMLNAMRPKLCHQCHTLAGHGNPGTPLQRFTVGNACQNCHSQIHGSNSPNGPRFQR
jgi:DmsE family decaheme c-type cytochrome